MPRTTSSRQTEPDSASLRAFLQATYGIDGEVRLLPGENANFRVETGDEAFVLKIAAHGQSPADFELEHAAIDHVAARLDDLSLPRSLPSRDGELVTLFDGDRPTRLMSLVTGRPWTEKEPPSTLLLEDLGRRVAQLDQALEDFAPATGERSSPWAPSRVAEHHDGVLAVDDPARRKLLTDALHYWLGCARPGLQDLPQSWIHGDVNDENLFVEGDRIVGVVDFGDVMVEATVGNLAIAVAYAMLRREDPLAAASAIVASYRRERSLSPAEEEVLFPLACGRLVTSLAYVARRRKQGIDRSNYYGTEEFAWTLLAALMAVDPAAAAARLLGAERDSPPTSKALLEQRRETIGPSLSIAYDEPLQIVRGSGQYLYDHRGRPYLDLVNNVCHVGHCHPHVVAAARRQIGTLNTNTRYLYPLLTEYVERLTGTLPEPLAVTFLVNSGSEANELALRMARTHTGHKDLLVVEGAYHGHTNTLIDISPYKFLGRGGRGAAEPWVHIVPMPDGYRGPHRGDDRATGVAYGDEVGRVISEAGRPVSGLILESLLGCGGQIIPPPGYLETAYGHIREAGGLCIADEVQVGFGRVGSHFWAFETQDVLPDIVVLGKPIGNGHPMAAVVTTREVAESFDNGMEFFSTFGGNPVSCAVGLAVLDVIEAENLQRHALELGAHFLAGLRDLQGRHELIGAVRGLGLFLGVELVLDRNTLEPAADAATVMVDRMKQRGILLQTDGPLHNVLKIKPPMVLDRADVDRTLDVLDTELHNYGRDR